MSLFQYPKSKHRRKLKPRLFKNYRSYKRYLQAEFARVCVYCRQPDSSAPNLAFSVDHYRPKSVPRFANLVCAYDNLYYCCGSCNSRKNRYWPIDEKAGPHVVNPCDYEMAAHLRFNGNTSRVEPKTPHGEPKTPHGEHTEELLQLNDEATVQYRQGTLRIVRSFSDEIEQQERQLKAIAKQLRAKKISQEEHLELEQAIIDEIEELRLIIQRQTGELPLPKLPQQRLGVTLLTP